MNAEEVYFWQIQWAGTWMTTHVRYSERAIKLEHPEARRVEGSRQLLLTPESPQERMVAARNSNAASPDVAYRMS